MSAYIIKPFEYEYLQMVGGHKKMDTTRRLVGWLPADLSLFLDERQKSDPICVKKPI